MGAPALVRHVLVSGLGLGVCLAAPAAAAEGAPHMNPNAQYLVANPLDGHEGRERAFYGEHFEVYSPPLRSKYSEVVWRMLDPVLLPETIRSRFNASVMAVTGYEVAVVRKTPRGDESVPCYESYNHHYVALIKGRHASQSKALGLDMGHGPMPMFHAVDGPEVPQVQEFSEHNGNEHRQTFHGFPKGYVQPIASPESFLFNPMQINLRNPDGSGRRGGPLPRASAAPPGAAYSGLLECPCTTRIERVLNGPIVKESGRCGDRGAGPRTLPVADAAACFAAAAELFNASAAHTATVSDGRLPPGCSASAPSSAGREVVFNTLESSQATCGASPAPALTAGRRSALVALDLQVDAVGGTMRIALRAGHGAWFGVGFGASTPGQQPYAIVVDGEGRVSERRLSNRTVGASLAPSVEVLSSVVEGGERSVVLTRRLRGRSPAHFDFSAGVTSVPFVSVLGAGPAVGAYSRHASDAVALRAIGGRTCVCRKPGGMLGGAPFDPVCPDWPRSDLLQTRNPSCDIATYVGGMQCCRDGMHLLDADQEVPPFVDEVFFKWRFYFTEYDPKVQTPTMHLEWALNGCDSGGPAGVAAACSIIEYDVPRAPPGTPPEAAVHTITSHFQVQDMMSPCSVRTDPYCADPSKVIAAGVKLIMAGGHCHAPACLSIELWDADSRSLLCRVEPRRGASSAPMDEEGYLWLPPCQWGSAAEGLRPPPVLHLRSNLTAVKRANASQYHYGVMAIWQMRAAYAHVTPAGWLV